MFAPRRATECALAACGRELRRRISKTTSVTNSDAMTPRLDLPTPPTMRAPGEEKGVPKKLLKLQKYHRYLSSLNSQQLPLAALGTAVSKDQSREFMGFFPDIVRELTENGKHQEAPEASKWIANLLQYTVPGGKKNRGLATVLAYKRLERPDLLTDDAVRLANVMGWCVEMFHAHQILLDDVMDGSETRRGAPCWHRRAHVGLAALNDAVLLQASMYSTLKRHFHDQPYYHSVLEMFNEMLLKTSMGQYMDMSMNRGDKPDLRKFTMDKYNAIVQYKTSYYTFQMPVGLAMLMAGISDVETHRQAKTVLLEMGQFFQIQDDFLDCFGNPAVTGKVGTDIEEGKCTWLAVVALQRASPAQRRLFEESYGSREPQHVAAVKRLYEELDLPHTYSVYEETSYNIIRTHIQQLTRGLPHDLFFNILDKIFKRDL